ncbi:MAG: hypothetical protein QOF01_919 [Thermomicrobiales bacterium]|nr:hypothetical protein [Thermomicrobiales bacterium]
MRQPGPPRRTSRPMDRQPRPQRQRDWRQTASEPLGQVGKRSSDRSIPFRHKPPLRDPQPGP